MNLKIFNHIKLSSSTEVNSVYCYRYQCPECNVFDHYLCLDPDAITWCSNCGEKIYFQEIKYINDPKICQTLFKVELGNIRTSQDDSEHFKEVEKEYLKELKEKYPDID